jgi:serine/threonine protein kinase/tetratricopeptide (TPR) repeat protein
MDIGRILATRYRIDRIIGHGGMGDIYLGTDLVEGHDVAIKRLKRELISPGSDVVERFLREGDIQKRLLHPAVVRVYEAIQHEDDYFLIMQYVGGGTLSALMKQQQDRKLPFKQALEVGLHLAGALQEAHEMGIVHRDLKPTNIIMTMDGEPRLTDFGAAKSNDTYRLTVTGMVIGTYSYMSPESCRGHTVDYRADIWSFGVLLFEMLTGVRPFRQQNPMQLMLAIMREPPANIQQLNPDIPDRLADLIYRMLTKDLYLRIPSMALIESELRNLLDGTSESSLATTRYMQTIDDSEFRSKREPSLPDFGRLLGRSKEKAEILKLIKDPNCRLITLQGAGGIGKTHLAVEIAYSLNETFYDGVYFVDLTDIKKPDNITAAIASALRFQFFGSEAPVQQLNDYLTNKNMLLVIDNFEQVITGVDLLPRLLKDSPQVQILITSRERANLRDEQCVSLNGLSKKASFELFTQTAQRIQSDYKPNEEEAVAIDKLLDLIDGSPLAIELAAGWVTMLTAAEIVDEMANGMGFLETHIRDVPERHRSIRNISENSWQLLNELERDALCRLSVFRGGFRREAIERVVGASLLTLNSLVDKSLLRRSPESGLYSMQELLRWFAAEKFDGMPNEKKQAIKEAHAGYYLNHLKELTPGLIGGDQVKSLGGIEWCLANIDIALNTAIEIKDFSLIETWVDGMYWFYLMRGRQKEGIVPIRRATFAVTMGGSNGLVQLKMMSRLGAYSRFVGENEAAMAILQECLKLARELKVPEEIAFTLCQLGAARMDTSESPAMWKEAYEIAKKINQGWLVAEISNWIAFYSLQDGQTSQAISWLECGMEERRRLGDLYGLAIISTNLGFIQTQIEDFPKAKILLEDALSINKEIQNLNGIGTVWNNLAHIALNEGEIEEAENAGRKALVYYEQSGNRRGRGEALGNLIKVAIEQQDYDTAEDLCFECIKLFKQMNLSVCVYVKEQGRIALAKGNLHQSIQYFNDALLGDSNTACKLSVLAGFGELLLLENSSLTIGNQLLQFVMNHEATELEVRRRVQAVMTTVSETLTNSTNNLAAPESVEDWVEYLSHCYEMHA